MTNSDHEKDKIILEKQKSKKSEQGKKISAIEFVKDLRAGMSYSSLMLKYQISSEEKLKKLLKQLISSGHLQRSDIKEKTQIHKCPSCGKTQNTEFSECPFCGIILSKYISKNADERREYANDQSIINKKNNTDPKKPKDKKSAITIGSIFSWIFGIVFLLLGLGTLFTTPLAGLCDLSISALLLPPVRKLAYFKTNFKIPVSVKAISILFLFIASGVFYTQRVEKEAQELAAQKAVEAQQLAAQKAKAKAENEARIKQENIEYFNDNKLEIIQKAKELLDDKQYQKALKYMEPYKVVEDKNLTELYFQANNLYDIEKAEENWKKQEQIRKSQAVAAAEKRRKIEQGEKESQAHSICMTAIKRRAKFPSSVDFHSFFGTSINTLSNGLIIVKIDFDAKNALGNELPYIGICKCKNGQLINIDIMGR